jgi:hypothetical protein
VLATRVKRAHKLFGQRLIVADPREHEMARRADIHFRPRPGFEEVTVNRSISTFLIILAPWPSFAMLSDGVLAEDNGATAGRPGSFPKSVRQSSQLAIQESSRTPTAVSPAQDLHEHARHR